jgi:hypothetical protein
MAKTTIVNLSTSIISNVNARTANGIEAEALRTHAAKLSDAQRMKCDVELVTYYAAQAGVATKAREKGEPAPCRCNLVAAWARDGKKLTDASNKASVALSRARAILFGTEKASSGASKADAASKAVAAIEKAINAAKAEKNKETLKNLKGQIAALMLLVS